MYIFISRSLRHLQSYAKGCVDDKEVTSRGAFIHKKIHISRDDRELVKLPTYQGVILSVIPKIMSHQGRVTLLDGPGTYS